MKTLEEMRKAHPVQTLTEAETQVELPANVAQMTLAEIARWLKARAAS